MNRIIAALLLATLFVTGCGNDSEPSQSEREQAFVSVIHEEIPGTVSVGQGDLVDLGESVCTALDNDAPLLLVVSNGVRAGFTPNEAGFIAGASIAAFCPEYENLVDELTTQRF